MTYGRINPSRGIRREKIAALRERDGDCCCRCHKLLDFNIIDQERPDFATLEHFPIPWRECRSHDLRFLKLAHRFCNERADMQDKACAMSVWHFERKWHCRQPEAMRQLDPDAAQEFAWAAHQRERGLRHE